MSNFEKIETFEEMKSILTDFINQKSPDDCILFYFMGGQDKALCNLLGEEKCVTSYHVMRSNKMILRVLSFIPSLQILALLRKNTSLHEILRMIEHSQGSMVGMYILPPPLVEGAQTMFKTNKISELLQNMDNCKSLIIEEQDFYWVNSRFL